VQERVQGDSGDRRDVSACVKSRVLAVVLMMVMALQVPEHELFETVDLYEEKDMTVMLDQQ
jgi:hypothetical protein